MKLKSLPSAIASITGMIAFIQCSAPKEQEIASPLPVVANYGGYESQEKWGEHLVLTSLCHDCHTPKKMTATGPVPDMDRMLSGHPSDLKLPDIDRKEIEQKGLVVTDFLTAWIGPWGVSFTANLTSDATGIGNWQESNFITALRHGKFKGIDSARPLLPPMPWEMLKNMTDEEMKAIFAYLKKTKPINNVVPEPLPPVLVTASK